MESTVISELHTILWRELAHRFQRAPNTMFELVSRLSLMRIQLEHVVTHAGSSLPTDLMAHRDSQLAQLIAAHGDLIESIDRTLSAVAKARAARPSALWIDFTKAARGTAVRAAGAIAETLDTLERRGLSFNDLPDADRNNVLAAIAGFTPLGLALARTEAFHDRLASLFDADRVRDARQRNGPAAGAKQLLALYLEVSVSTVRRRIQRTG